MKRIGVISLRIVLFLLALLLALTLLLQTSFFQNWLVRQAASRLSKNLNTTVSIRHVDFSFFDKMDLQGVLVLDRKKDTLLYAGEAKVNITDWFFFKDNIVLKYLSLKDTYINIYRKDSVWNYQFIADYFSSPSKKKDTSTNVLQLDLKRVEMSHVKFWQRDGWVGTDMLVSFDGLAVEADSVSMKGKRIHLKNISIDKPYFAQYEYEGNRPPKSHHSGNAEVDKTTGLRWNTDNWAINVDNISLSNGGVAIERQTSREPYLTQFDDSHIIFSALQARIKNVALRQDTLFANVDLSAKNRSGFIVKKLQADMHFSPVIMEFNNLDIVTNNSHLTNYYSMGYHNFNEDMNDFVTAVTLKGNFRNSVVSSDDIAYFAPELNDWKRVFKLTGKAGGTIADLSATNVSIQTGNSNFAGTVRMKGLPDIDTTLINIHADDLNTSYKEIASFIPQLRKVGTPDLSQLGNIHFAGNYSGLIDNFKTEGLLNSDLGSINADVHINLSGKSAGYDGKISTPNFQLGRFIHDSNLGALAFDGTVTGKGFSDKNFNVAVDGRIDHLFFNDYNYHNIVAKGIFNNKMFQGSASINDINAQVENVSGSIDLNNKLPQFRLSADVKNVNLQNLHLTNQQFSVTGLFNLDFTGNNLDNFLGTARLYDATLTTNKRKLSFDSLALSSFYTGNVKHLQVVTNELEANIAGNFKLAELPDAFQLFLNRYYPVYIERVKKSLHPQNFTFSIAARNIEDYVNLLDKRLKGFNNSNFTGSLNLSTNELTLNATVPDFSYGTTNFKDATLKALGSYDSLSVDAHIAQTALNDSLRLPDTRIVANAHNDETDIRVNTSANQGLNDAELSVRLQTLADGFNVIFNPSSFVINQKKWSLEKGGQLALRKNVLTASEVRFVQDQQQLILSTTPSLTGSSDLNIAIRNLNLGDISPLVMRYPRLEGSLSGNILVRDPFKTRDIEFNTRTEQFRFENDSVGVIAARGTYSFKENKLQTKVSSANERYNFNSDFSYKGSDSTNDEIYSVTTMDHTSISFLAPYLEGVFSGIKGVATGTLTLSGKAKAPKLTGQVSLNGAAMTVDYTRCRYWVDENSTLTFNPDEIDLGRINIRDTFGHKAFVTGKISHNFFDNFYYENVSLNTVQSGGTGKLLVLNTTLKDNKDFYGYVVANATMTLNGPDNDMRMYIAGEPTDSSHLYLPTTESAEGGKVDYIQFVKFGREMKNDFVFKKQTNIKATIDLTANPYAQIDVILDPETGDIIRAKGSGRLNMTVGTRDPLIIRGRYDVSEGDYTFNFQQFLKTPFLLKQGYIEWQGDPYQANMNIDATYRAANVDLSSIPTSFGSNKYKGDIDILFKLRGTLKDPRPDFEFQYTFNNPLRSDPIANEYLKTKVQGDRNEMNKTVTSLLLFNTLVPDQQLLGTANTTNFVSKSLGQIVSSTLSSSFSNWLQRLFKSNSITSYLNLNPSDLTGVVTPGELKNLGGGGVRNALLKGRLLLSAGVAVDRYSQSTTNSTRNFLLTPDFSFEYLITPDGKLRVVGFNRSDAALGDIAGITRRNRTGILLSYHKDFDGYSPGKK